MAKSDVSNEKAERGDAALVALAKAGNAPAIEQLVRKYWPDAYRTAIRILRCHADAEDAAQDVLCCAMAHLSTFREDASLRTWIHRITINRSLMLLRRKSARKDSSSLIPFEDVLPFLSGGRTPEQMLLEAEGRAVVEDGLDGLPERYASVLQLSIFEGRSTSEIAASVELSPAAVRTRLHRGRVRLLRRMGWHLRPYVAEKPLATQCKPAAW